MSCSDWIYLPTFQINLLMPEFLLHTIWLHGLFRTFQQQTTEGLPVEVIDPGLHNPDAGPDFSAAQLRIGGQLMVGNVEIHIKSSDWYHHGHHTDPAYDSCVLHVVRRADREVLNSRGERIPQCELRYPEDPSLLEGLLAEHSRFCAQPWSSTDPLDFSGWKRALLEDRILKKAAAINQLLQLSQRHWEQAFYITLAHNFGFHTNSLPFELTVKQTPLAFLLKHRDSLFQLQAMLLGQSGLLEAPFIGKISLPSEAKGGPKGRVEALQNEYRFLQKKFSLVPIDGSLWKYGRMRPQNFPHVRILQFAELVHREEFLFSKVIEQADLGKLRELFSMSRSTSDLLIINSVVPYKYAWARAHNDAKLQQTAFELLDRLPAEKNSIIDQWKELGVPVRSAADSQAFLHLYQEYCLRQRCLTCDLGYDIFSAEK